MTKSPTKRTDETNEDTTKPEQLEEIRLVKKEFSFKLTTDEVATKALRVADLTTAKSEAEYALDRAKGQFKAEEARIDALIAHELGCVRTRTEMREVEVEQVHDFARKVVFWRFGQDILGERAMEQRERQASLPLKERPDASPSNDQEPAKSAPGATSEAQPTSA